MADKLRDFSEVRIEEDCTQLKGAFDNALFFGCTFCNLNRLTLKDCDLNHSKFITESVKDALGLTITLDCHSFGGVEFSPLLFDLMLCLLTTTVGNDEKRNLLKAVVGSNRYAALRRVLRTLE